MLWLMGTVACRSLAERDGLGCHGRHPRDHHRHDPPPLPRGEVTPGALTRCYVDRIAALNPLLGAVISINPGAWRAAGALDKQLPHGIQGPLFGIPVLVEDSIAVAGIQATAGSMVLYNMLRRETPTWWSGSAAKAPSSWARPTCRS